jgi:Tfp pilus assembly protein PilX
MCGFVLQICCLHRAYIQTLLKKALFARQLAALRELESLLQHTERLPDDRTIATVMEVCLSAPSKRNTSLTAQACRRAACHVMSVDCKKQAVALQQAGALLSTPSLTCVRVLP